MPRAVADRGKRGLEFGTKIVLDRAIIDPTRTGPMLFEDFILDHVAEDAYLVSQSGTATTAAAITASAGAPVTGHGGWIAGAVDNVDNEIDEVGLGGAAGWLVPAALGVGELIVCEVALVIPTALTARMYFAGLGDALTGGADDDGMISIVTGTTLVSGATGDAVGFVYSSLATNVDQWYCGAVKATAVGTAYDTSVGTYGDAMDAATVDDYTKLRVEVDVAGNAYFYSAISTTKGREQKPVFRQMQALAVTAASAFNPVFSAASTTTAAVEWEVDYMFGAADR
jgi:hypothetical protein